jgi:archaellum component FlaD/FlaE
VTEDTETPSLQEEVVIPTAASVQPESGEVGGTIGTIMRNDTGQAAVETTARPADEIVEAEQAEAEQQAAAAAAQAPVNNEIEREPVEVEEPETTEEMINPVEEQTDRFSQPGNTVVNNVSGLAQPVSAPEENQAPQALRNEEQIQLQNVGTQLAQIVPPSSIISVLG